MREVTVTTFGELIRQGILEIGDGYRAKLSELGGSGPIFLRAGRLSDRGFDWVGVERFHGVESQKLEPKLGRPGDTVITTKGNSVGRAGFVPDGAPEFVYSPHLSYWRTLDDARLASGFLRYWARGPEFTAQLRALAHSTDMAPYLSLLDQKNLVISLPPMVEQRAIADVLTALDDKIESNVSIRGRMRSLAFTHFQRALEQSSYSVTVASVSASISRGVAPTYSPDGMGIRVLNQRCIRDGWASIEASRWMYDDSRATARTARLGDVLVNSTGVGTLGRVARWLRMEPIAVDGHVTVVRPDPKKCDPVALGYAMLLAQPTLSALGEGSTGQTELSRARLGEMRIDVPRGPQPTLSQVLSRLDEYAEVLAHENARLVAERDALLPRLMSGELRVRDVEGLVGEAV